MKIGIAGSGVGGAYLAYSLSPEHEIKVFDKREESRIGEDCAWGTSLRTLKKYTARMDEDYKKYILYEAKDFVTDVFKNRDAVTFDKNKFLRDFLKASDAEAHFKKDIRNVDLDEFDLLIDATGPNRVLLPPPRPDVEGQWICPCYQVDVSSEDLPDDFYFELKESWYLWSFPLKGEEAKVGCASVDSNPKREVEEFLAGRDYELIDEIWAKVRGLPPSYSEPFFVNGDPPVFGVGEAIGTVSPFSGEGITYTLICSDLFLDSFRRHEKMKRVAEDYRRKVLKEFDWIKIHFDFVNSVRFGNPLSQIWNLIRAPVPKESVGGLSKLRLFRERIFHRNRII